MSPPSPDNPHSPSCKSTLPPAQPCRSYVCPRTRVPIVIDGDIGKPAWESAPWSDDFVDIEGDLQPKPLQQARVKMLWDGEHVYFAAQMLGPDVWATLAERDSVIFHDNDFEIFLNPSCDSRDYYELEINALNTVWDLHLANPYRQGGQPTPGWSIEGLRTAVHVDGEINNPAVPCRGWTVEVAIPFAALDRHCGRGDPVPRIGDVWKVNFSRVEWDLRAKNGRYEKIEGRPEHNWVWSPMGLIDMHLPDRWGEVRFEG
jgi:Carbohydrate family 9 binding domain-like